MPDLSTDQNPERLRILEMIDSSAITPEEGLLLIKALSGETVSTPQANDSVEAQLFPQVETLEGIQATSDESANSDEAFPTAPQTTEWRRWWQIPLWVGVGIVVMSGLLIYMATQSAGTTSLWFFCAWLPFLIGLSLMIFALLSRNARWAHIRVHQASGEWPSRIALSFPLPLRPTAWFLRTFKPYIPALGQTGADEVVTALMYHVNPDNPLYIQVEEGERGERIEVFIG